MKHFAIVANGSFLVREIIVEAVQDKIIVALDGASQKLALLNIMPQVILGDFDSLTDKTMQHFGIKNSFAALTLNDPPYQGANEIMIIPVKDQSKTDLQKGIAYCDQEGATSITLLCATGGRLDHQESILRTLRTAYKKERPIYLHTEQQTIRFAKDETIELNGKPGDKCGLLAYPEGRITSKGLEYEANDFKLQFGFSENTCNALVTNKAKVTVQGEALVIMPAQLSNQRLFMQLTEVERLKRLLRDATCYQITFR